MLPKEFTFGFAFLLKSIFFVSIFTPPGLFFSFCVDPIVAFTSDGLVLVCCGCFALPFCFACEFECIAPFGTSLCIFFCPAVLISKSVTDMLSSDMYDSKLFFLELQGVLENACSVVEESG